MVTMLDLEQLTDSEELFDGRYRLLYPLSTDGATADIWLAVDTNTVDYELSDNNGGIDEDQGLKVAIKVYRPQNVLDIEGIQRFRNEFKVVFNCQHSNLLHPVHFSIFKDTPYLVLPYCQNGSTELITGQMQRDEDIWKFVHDVASGLNYLHTNNPQIVHQDIKPANILIDDNRNYAITDFGISISRKQRIHAVDENSGTLAYMAPERFMDGTQPMPESDIWAFGATLYELITGMVPFGENGGSEQTEEKPTLNYPKGCCSKNVQRIIAACLTKAPQKRPSARQLMEYANKRSYYGDKKLNKGFIWGVVGTVSVLLIAIVLFALSRFSTPSRDNTIEDNSSISGIVEDDSEIQKLSDDEEKKNAIYLYGSLDEVPQFKGGYEELCNYLSRSLTIKSRNEED